MSGAASRRDAHGWTRRNLAIRRPGASDITAVVTVLAFVFLFAPLAVMAVYSFNDSRSTVVWTGFSLRWYANVFANGALHRALQTSLFVAAVSALVSTAIGATTALALVKHRFPGRDALATLLMAPLVIPEIVIAVALLVLMVFADMTLGLTTMIIGHVVVTVPFTTLTIRAAAASLDPRLDEAAADLGGNEWQIFRRVTFPLLLPAIGTAFLMAATLSFDNFVMSVFTSGVGTTPLPLRVYSMLKLGITPEINALGALMVLVNVLVMAGILRRSLRSFVSNTG